MEIKTKYNICDKIWFIIDEQIYCRPIDEISVLINKDKSHSKPNKQNKKASFQILYTVHIEKNKEWCREYIDEIDAYKLKKELIINQMS